MKFKQFSTSSEVRSELSYLYHLVKNEEISTSKASTMSNLLYKIIASIQTELKEKEVRVQYQLAQEIERLRGGK